MRRTFGVLLVSTGLVALAACSDSREAAPAPGAAPEGTSAAESTSITTTATTSASEPTSPETAAATDPATSEPADTATTSAPRSTTTTEPRSTTTKPDRPVDGRTQRDKRKQERERNKRPKRLPGVANPRCVVEIRSGDSLSAIADSVDDGRVTVERLQRQNGIADPDAIRAGDYLDVCIDEIDDITGDKRDRQPAAPPPPPSDPGGGGGSGVTAQQQQLNSLFGGTGFPELAVDGDSGPYTEQALCAARMMLNLPVNRNDMATGSSEEGALMYASSLGMPAAAPTWAGRWALIDRTCQVMFVGSGGEIVFVFPVSTGEAGHETRLQDASGIFRYDPATENGGWHDSTTYPVEIDNPLNGNMYKPLYFDGGQAIHGAGNVPTYPASKGCVRMQVGSQDTLVGWLGLQDVTSPLWDGSNIGMVVTVVGEY